MTNRNESESLTARTLIEGARMYAAATDAVNAKYPYSYHVMSQLLGMSVELALKAYLRFNNWETRDLKNMGHDLSKIYTAACKCGFPESRNTSAVLRTNGKYYMMRLFIYPENYRLPAFKPKNFRREAEEIISAAYRTIFGDAEYDQNRDGPGIAINSIYLERDSNHPWYQMEPDMFDGLDI